MMASGAERQVPVCPICLVVLNINHILVECPRFSHERRANSLFNLPFADILGDGGFIDNVLKFLKEIHLFYDI